MEVEIVPEPSPEERRAILAALDELRVVDRGVAPAPDEDDDEDGQERDSEMQR